MIDPTTLTDEALYVEIHTWEHQREHNAIDVATALQPLYREAADRWMAEHEYLGKPSATATVHPPVVRGPVVRSWLAERIEAEKNLIREMVYPDA